MHNGNGNNEFSLLDRYLASLSVEVSPFALCLLDSGWKLTLPGPPCAMLHFVVSGEGWLSAPDGTHEQIGPNWLIVVPAGLVHSLETREDFERELRIDCTPSGPPVHRIMAGDDGPVEMVVGCGILNVRFRDTVGLFDHLNDLLIVDLSEVPEVPSLFQALIVEQGGDEPGGPVLQGAIMTQLMVHLLRNLIQQSNDQLTWLKALEDPRLSEAIDRIMEDPAAPHTVESLADVAHMSRSAFSRHFQDAFHTSPMQLVNHVRLERAARMLINSSLPVKMVASRCGFSSRSHFSHAFKAHSGVAPVEFRSRAEH
jgi:AraC-like DNA-binding protein